MLTDQEVIDGLRRSLKTYPAIGAALHGVARGQVKPTAQMICNWRARGVPPAWRPYVARVAVECELDGFNEAQFVRQGLPQKRSAA